MLGFRPRPLAEVSLLIRITSEISNIYIIAEFDRLAYFAVRFPQAHAYSESLRPAPIITRLRLSRPLTLLYE